MPFVDSYDIGLLISCSWEVGNGKSISDTITCDSVVDDRDGLENVSLDTCVLLIQGNFLTPCPPEIKVTVNKDVQITQLCIVTEARVIETHGKFGEYLNTTSAEFIDEFNDMAVYMADIPIAQPSSECSLKFARLKNIDKMWLYGIHLSIQKVMPPAQTEACVNFQHVNRLLKESTLQLTEKAEKCKRFLQLYSLNTDPSKNASKRLDPQMLLKMFESQYLDQYTHLEDKAKCVTKSLAEMLPVFTRGLKEKSQHCIEDKTQLKEELKINSCDTSLPINIKTTEQNTPNYFVDLFKEYINKRFLECEKNILSRVEEKLDALEKKQDEKFDSILKQLKLLGSSTVNTH